MQRAIRGNSFMFQDRTKKMMRRKAAERLAKLHRHVNGYNPGASAVRKRENATGACSGMPVTFSGHFR